MNWDRFKFESVLFYEIETEQNEHRGVNVVITEKEKGLLVAKYR